MGTNGTDWSSLADDQNFEDAQTDQAVQQIVNQINNQAFQNWVNAPADVPQQAQSDEPPDWMGQDMQSYLSQNPNHHVLDMVADPEVHSAMMPSTDALPWYVDKKNPQALSRAGKLVTVLMTLGQGALAGHAASEQALMASGGHRTAGFGMGYQYAQRAAEQLQELNMRRQLQQQLANYRQAETAKLNAQVSAFPQQQADLSAQRQARTDFLKAQTKLKLSPGDKYLRSYEGADGNMRYSFQKPTGEIYERTGGAFHQATKNLQLIRDQIGNVYKIDENGQPKLFMSFPILSHGANGSLWQVNPATNEHKHIFTPPNPPNRISTPETFAKLDRWKTTEWNKIMRDMRFDGNDEGRNQALQNLQDTYESNILRYGGTLNGHYDVASGTTMASPPEPEFSDNAPQVEAAPQSWWSQIPGAVRRH